MSKPGVEKYDAQMRPTVIAENGIRWYSPKQEPFRIAGFAWLSSEDKYRRMPTLPKGRLPEAVDYLADHTAGGQIHFRTDSTTLLVRVKLKEKANMVHMPATGQCGVDCYIGEFGQMKFVNITKYEVSRTEYEASLFAGLPAERRNIVLNMPLYQGVEEIWVGLDEGASVEAPPNYLSDKKVLIYGTSITQGGCATRPGMAYPNILSRRIPLEFINLGFSGSGKGESEVAETIAQIENPACLILDYEGNCVSTELFRKTLPEFIRIFRAAHPDTTIVVMSRIRYVRESLDVQLYQDRIERRQFQQSLVDELRDAGDRNIYFRDGSDLLGDEDDFECTVDGVHPTDLGFLRMANGIEPWLRQLLIP